MPGLKPLDLPVTRALLRRQRARMASAAERADVFSEAECTRIIALREHFGVDEARVEPREAPDRREVDRSIRQTERSHLLHSSETAWIYARMAALVEELNAEVWRFRISHMEPMQLLRYHGGGHYGWHADLGVQGVMALRKLSVTVQLSDGEDYTGGNLELMSGGRTLVPQRPRGSAVVFPSWLPHRVTPVTEGTRDALVLWVVGKRPLR